MNGSMGMGMSTIHIVAPIWHRQIQRNSSFSSFAMFAWLWLSLLFANFPGVLYSEGGLYTCMSGYSWLCVCGGSVQTFALLITFNALIECAAENFRGRAKQEN